jgi:hypothetical protein
VKKEKAPKNIFIKKKLLRDCDVKKKKALLIYYSRSHRSWWGDPRDPRGWRAVCQRILHPVLFLPKQKRLQVLGIRVPVSRDV